MKNQALLDSVAYKTYYAIASRAEPPKSRKSQKKSNSAISSEESPSKKKSAIAKKVAATKPKLTKKKETVKADRGKGLNVLSEVALSKVDQLKEATKRSKKDFYISQASDLCDGTNLESGFLMNNITRHLGDSKEEDNDDEDDIEDDEGNDDDNDDNYDNSDNDETDSDRTESDRINILVLNQSTTEYYKEEEEKVDDEEKMEKEDDEVTKKLYKDVNVNLGNKDTDMTYDNQGGSGQQNISQESGFEQVEEDAHVTLTPVLDTQKTDEPLQSSSVSSDFTSKLLNLKNPSLADNEIASLMDTIVRHEELGSHTSSLNTVPIMAIPAITSVFTTTIPPPPPFFNPLLQQATPTTSKATTSFLSLPDFSYVFKFNDRVTNLEKDLSEIKQVDQYAQALSSILAIVDCYIDNKLGEAIQKTILAHNLDCRKKLKLRRGIT
ncbi:hypothetical protein Tco_1520953, partial [Tanacetum coccineum]